MCKVWDGAWRIAVLMMAAIPAGWLLGPLFGLEITLGFPAAYAWAALGALALGATRVAVKQGEVCPAVLPLALSYGVRMPWAAGKSVCLPVALSVLCVMIVYAPRAKRGGLRLVCSACSAALVPAFLMFLFAALFPLDKATVVSALPSPSGRYIMTVTDVDEGALGGSTLVEVRDTRFELDLKVMRLRSEKKRIETRGWGAYETMEIVWQDDNTLLLDGKRYMMDESK